MLNPKKPQTLNFKYNINDKMVYHINTSQHLTIFGIDWCSNFSRTLKRQKKRMIQSFVIDTKMYKKCLSSVIE